MTRYPSPKGWGIAHFERPRDFTAVWEKLKGHTTIVGGVLISLMASGIPKQIDEYVKNLVAKIKPKGGFILSPRVSELSVDTSVANVRAYINAALKY